MIDIVDDLNFKEKNILDIGCYDGTFLFLVKNKKNKFYGIETSDYGVRESRKKGIAVERFFIDDKTKLPFKNDFFDLVIAGEIIEHIYDTDFFLREIYRLLKKDGFLLISTPNIASFGRRLMLFFGLNPIIEISPNEQNSSGHIRYFTFRTLKKLLKKHGFKIIIRRPDIINFSSNGRFKLAFLARIFPNFSQSLIFLVSKNL